MSPQKWKSIGILMAKKAVKADSGLKPGYLLDFISGVLVKATPEEVEAVQVFSQRLVEDYGYPKSHIQTRPQFRVRCRPSDEDKSYPVDIAVFRSDNRIEDNLFMVVECKKKTRKDGLAQLKLHLDMSAAEVGVWFNGNEHEYLRKVHHRDGLRITNRCPIFHDTDSELKTSASTNEGFEEAVESQVHVPRSAKPPCRNDHRYHQGRGVGTGDHQ